MVVSFQTWPVMAVVFHSTLQDGPTALSPNVRVQSLQNGPTALSPNDGCRGIVFVTAHLRLCASNGADPGIRVFGLIWPVGSTVLPVALATPVIRPNSVLALWAAPAGGVDGPARRPGDTGHWSDPRHPGRPSSGGRPPFGLTPGNLE